MLSSINEFIGIAYDMAYRHGFHDEKTSFEHQMMLVISEVGEMVEADRKCRHAQMVMFDRESVTPQPDGNEDKHWKFCFEQFIKDTVEDEMADVCIRLFDMCGYFDIEPYRANKQIASLWYDWVDLFGDMTFCEQSYALVRLLTGYKGVMGEKERDELFGSSLAFIHYFACRHDIDLSRHIRMKMRYNDMRSYKHGKKY